MWNEQKIEKILQEALIREYGQDQGSNYYSDYTTARNYLVGEIFSEIKGKEPNLSDHSAEHVANVLKNVWYLLGENPDILTPLELYCLCLIVLFHDAGNIEGRHNHNNKIAGIYNTIRNRNAKYNQERFIVLKAARAHCGFAIDNTRDTLKDVDKITNIDGNPIRLQELASILRFADELAEGPQRTSDYMCKTGAYTKESQLFHQYASITNIFIDRHGERIALTYNIDILSSNNQTIENFKNLMQFTYQRIIKLDEERRYTKHYSELLLPFKKTEIKFNFLIDGIPTEFDIPIICMEDLFPIPTEGLPKQEILLEGHPELNLDKIVEKLNISQI